MLMKKNVGIGMILVRYLDVSDLIALKILKKSFC